MLTPDAVSAPPARELDAVALVPVVEDDLSRGIWGDNMFLLLVGIAHVVVAMLEVLADEALDAELLAPAVAHAHNVVRLHADASGWLRGWATSVC